MFQKTDKVWSSLVIPLRMPGSNPLFDSALTDALELELVKQIMGNEKNLCPTSTILRAVTERK